MTKLVFVCAILLAACGGKKSPATTPPTGGSAQVADPKAGSDAKPDVPKETPEEDPCAVPPPQ